MHKNTFALRLPIIVFMIALFMISLTGCSSPSKWIVAAKPALTDIAVSLTTIGRQLTMVSKDPNLLTDENWKSETKAVAASLKKASQAMQTLPEPENDKLKEMDVVAKKIGNEGIAAANNCSAFIDDNTADHLTSCSAHMDEMAKLLTRLNELLTEYNQ